MRKRSKGKATLDKADRQLQSWYRWRYPKARCEVCGDKSQVMHHHLAKSKSNAGRYHPDNLIFLCHKCHSKIVFGDYQVVARYSIKRGAEDEEWLERMEKLKREKKSYFSKKELEQIIENYKCPIIKTKLNLPISETF